MDAAKTVTATFTQIIRTLSVTVAGSGAVNLSPASREGTTSCSTPSCSPTYVDGTAVTLTAAPALGYVFSGWGGDCSFAGTSLTCLLTMSANRSVTAAFGVAVPSTPTGLSASASSGQVTLTWNPVSGATSYILYMASVSGVTKSNYSTLADGMTHTGVTSPYIHTGLTNGKTYYFVLTASNTGGESAESSQVSATPLLSAAFGTATNYATGTNPLSVAIGDVNADSKPDLAVANYGSDTVSILLGTGAGSFGAATSFTAGVGPGAVAIGEFNANGKPDLAVANQDSDNVSILLGAGTGSFGEAIKFAAGTGPRSVAIGNLNADSWPDLAVAHKGSANISILLGNSAGSFGAATSFTAGTSPRSVAIGDFNADSWPDLAVANQDSNNVSILLGAGTGSFGAATHFV
ncbi:MAG: FG-GAP-like repeat-containing protein, partial [Nitrospirota bacterium]